MGLWSSINKVAKTVARIVKAAALIVVRSITTFSFTITYMYDLLFGVLNWPPKHLTLHVLISNS